MSDDDRGKWRDRVGTLEARIKAARESGPDGRDRKRAEARERSRADGIAWRISAELVAAFLVCGFIGWWADEWAGTRPWIFLAGLLIGGAVGIRNVYRVAMNVQRAAEKREDE